MRIFYLLGLITVCLVAMSACNQSSVAPIQIADAWIREAPPGASAMAGYMRIINTTENDIILQQVSSPNFKAIEFHRSVEKNGVYKMVPHLHIHIAANSTFELKPGDYHLMMFSPVSSLKDGDTIEIDLQFSDQHIISTAIPVKKAEY